MLGSDLYMSLIIGIVLSLIYAEKTGVLPAGLIVPGYLALIFDQPVFLVLVFLISFLTYLIVAKVLSRFTILYGRRKFAAMMTVGITLKLLFDYFYPLVPFEVHELTGIGVIVPGLIANGIFKQGVLPTVGSTLLMSALTFVFMLVYHVIM
ncbi:poly-gamma-glutamate biosynthesis protein PgsC/CapC [Caldalkalibacillus uzonensis]|uniref:Poly-gamma-glutamate biosynthesis protein PgsC/CapC n=1 Tax=Caldalkalibacillus uzonensis TaxID=353224 RepID=A0ABU0CQ24_9BACI|nr:poly-gamma-glutamate biosynthesis protein PgsC [Caldalkalibacillus uzonensis]MDQ0338518.1 poly-gamma-glutamate biosynthesis protein PgsC/CapC [Caldalkalibacillus uzonensis]